MTPDDIVDDRLGTLRFASYWPGWTADLDRDGESLHVAIAATDVAVARSRLPRLKAAVAALEKLSEAGIRYLVDALSEGEVEEGDYSEAYADLLVIDVVIDADGTLAVHFSDECGEHFLDGYWPAVHYDAEDRPVDWTLEA